MSQNFFKLKNPERKVVYGWDAPTGGFFWMELDKDGERIAGADEMLLSDLAGDIFLLYGVAIDIKKLAAQLKENPLPTDLQCLVGSMYGKNIMAMCKRCMNEILGVERMTGSNV